MTRLLALILAMLIASCTGTTPARAPVKDRRIHALFVGIDRYRFSSVAGFSNLKGAVGDALRFKQAMHGLYGVNVDKPAAETCESANAATTTLTDRCATRARILSVLNAQIDALKPGDTLLFYFAGHGSQYRDDEARDQDTGYNGTILPTDARNPDGSPGDIFDVELKALKDRATARGLYFVTIFDSCNSATATRDGAAGQSRSVPPLVGATPPPPEAAPPSAGSGYWVHLAAAQDGEEAQETGAIGARAGVFTSALIDTLHLPTMRDATFSDIIKEVRLRVARRGHVAQTPSAEGELTAAMGSRSRSPLLFPVTASGGTLTLQAGSLSGITTGSRFAIYARQADAVGQTAQLASATVTGLQPGVATLAIDGGSAKNLPPDLVAEETAHFFPADLIGVSNDLPPGPARDTAAAALAKLRYVSVVTSGATHLALAERSSSRLALRTDDGTILSDSLGEPTDPAFTTRLTDELQKVARVAQLLSIRTVVAGEGTRAGPAVQLCIAVDGYRPTACPPLDPGGVRRIDMKDRVSATVVNRGPKSAYLYLLAIDPRNAVDLILPKPNEIDRKLQPGMPYRRSQMSFDTPGAYRFVTIVTDTPIRAEAFQQRGSGSRDIAGCASPLARLLCAANEGTRDPGVTAVGDWSAQVTTALITTQEPIR